MNRNLFLRIPLIIILLVHGLAGLWNNGINNFGNLYLNQIGFAPFGLYLAWLVKLSHVVLAICLLFNKYLKWPLIANIFILLVGIFILHIKEGWFVVGGGRNGVEFNVLLIFVLLYLLFEPKKEH
jgi:putative oxidoreductase